MRLRRLLVPADFTWRSRSALTYAVAIAGPSASIDVLHVAPAPSVARVVLDAYLDWPLPSPSAAARAHAEEQLDLFLSSSGSLRTRLRGMVEFGDPAATIVRVAVERRANLIVIGTHARTGLAEALLGSVAHRVITCAPCPVLTLRGVEASASAAR